MVEDKLKAVTKVQYVDSIPRVVKGKVGDILHAKDERRIFDQTVDALDLNSVLNRNVNELSGGELQRFAIAVCVVQDADVYIFDEPSSYLDVKQRLRAAEVIRSLAAPEKYVIVVEHDLSVLDYLSDFICVLYGEPGAYGVVTMPFGVREGINVFLDGFVPTENLRFREESLKFRLAESAGDTDEVASKKHALYSYPAMTKKLGNFTLSIEAGGFTDSEIIVMLGENGTGSKFLAPLSVIHIMMNQGLTNILTFFINRDNFHQNAGGIAEARGGCKWAGPCCPAAERELQATKDRTIF